MKRKYVCALAAQLLMLLANNALSAQTQRLPVFDVHLHAATTPANDAAIRAMQDSMNVTRAVYMGTPADLAKISNSASTTYLRGLFFPCELGKLPNVGAPCFADNSEFPDTTWLRAQVKNGSVQVFGEIGAQYMGVAPNDSRMMPYYALAEELDVPVGIHLGIGPPGVSYPGPRRMSPHYAGQAGDPRLLESILVAHPKMRLYVMHAAWPYLEEMTYMLYMHPQLYVDISVLQYAIPRPAYLTYLRALMDAGFGERIMFGSDGGARFLKEGVNAILGADFLSDKQKRDILYDNAARFFKIAPTSTPPRDSLEPLHDFFAQFSYAHDDSSGTRTD